MTVEALAGRLLRTRQVCPAALPASSATRTHHFSFFRQNEANLLKWTPDLGPSRQMGAPAVLS